MKRSLISLVLVAIATAFFAFPSYAQNCKDSFEKAENCRRRGQYNKALQLYTKSRDCGDATYQTKSAAMIRSLEVLLQEQEAVKAAAIKESKQSYIIAPSLVYLPAGTEEQTILVESSGDWNVQKCSEIIHVSKKNARTLSISSIVPNTSTKTRTSSIVVESGEISRIIVVEQDGVPELLEYKTKYLKIPPAGGDFIVDIRTNLSWKVKSSYDWYKASVMDQDSTRMIIHIDTNTRNLERTGTIEIESESGDSHDVLTVYQYPNESRIFTPVEEQISFTSQRDTVKVPIISDNEYWTVSDCPSWCQEQKISADTLMIVVAANDSFVSREGYANIKSGDRVSGILIRQAASEAKYDISKTVVGGNNISFGITGGPAYPIIAASAGGSFLGSAVNYSFGDASETPNYTATVGFSVEAFADIRLYRNLYLMAGINYTRYSYSNTFTSDKERDILSGFKNFYYRGKIMDSYTERYTVGTLDIPILMSYRIPISRTSHIQFNAGPAISYGLTADMVLSGNAEGEGLRAYEIVNNQKTKNPYMGGTVPSAHHIKHDATMNMYGSFVQHVETYTESNNEPINKSTTIKAEPFKRLNIGARFGIAYELNGIKLSVEYNQMLTNMANKKYWESDRWMIFDQSGGSMSGYHQYIHTLQFRIGYTFRYL